MKILSALLTGALIAACASAHADTDTYTFTGTCDNCNGVPTIAVTGTVTLINYKAGASFGLSNYEHLEANSFQDIKPTSFSGNMPVSSGFATLSAQSTVRTDKKGNTTFEMFDENADGIFHLIEYVDNGTYIHKFSGSNGVWTLSKVIASPAPEPETYAMLMLGLGLIGFVARSRPSQKQ